MFKKKDQQPKVVTIPTPQSKTMIEGAIDILKNACEAGQILHHGYKLGRLGFAGVQRSARDPRFVEYIYDVINPEDLTIKSPQDLLDEQRRQDEAELEKLKEKSAEIIKSIEQVSKKLGKVC